MIIVLVLYCFTYNTCALLTSLITLSYCFTYDNWFGIVLSYIQYRCLRLWHINVMIMLNCSHFCNIHTPHVDLYMWHPYLLNYLMSIDTYFTHTSNSLTRVICFFYNPRVRLRIVCRLGCVDCSSILIIFHVLGFWTLQLGLMRS